MKIALAPFIHRHLSLKDLPGKAAKRGYAWIGLSPRAEFLAWFEAPCAFACEDKADESGRFVRQSMQSYVEKSFQ